MNRAGTDERVDLLRGEIAHTRAALGDTVQELAARADVPARARRSARQAADRMRAGGDQPRLWAAAAAGVAALAGLVLWARFSRRRRQQGADWPGGAAPAVRGEGVAGGGGERQPWRQHGAPWAPPAGQRMRSRLGGHAPGPIERWRMGGGR